MLVLRVASPLRQLVARDIRHATPSFQLEAGYHVQHVPQTVPHPWDITVPQLAQPEDRKLKVAVVGGGITGMVTALNLARWYNQDRIKITIYESGPRLGGWINSSRVELPDGNGNVLFETGPHTLRPAGESAWYMFHLLDTLDMYGDVLSASKTSPAAQNRFIYYPDRLHRMPSPTSISAGEAFDFLMKSLLGKPILPGALKDIFSRRVTEEDISIGTFLERNFNRGVANLASAVFHGIYAGDLYQLSLGAILPQFLHHARHSGSIIAGMTGQTFKNWLTNTRPIEFPDMKRPMLSHILIRNRNNAEAVRRLNKGASVYSFQDGMAQLASKLETALKSHDNIDVKLNTRVTSIEPSTVGKTLSDTYVKLKASPMSVQKYSYVAATVPSASLAPMISAPRAPKADVERIKSILAHNPSVSVMVVNLYYAKPDLLPVKGFGYLIPRDIPFEQNPELALGVLFDSDTIQGQDQVPRPGTKVTVMMGGHYWDDFRAEDIPTSEEAIRQARSLLKRHLNLTEVPTLSRATFQKDCIPQYLVGHPGRMEELNQLLGGKNLRYLLRVGGSSYSGVGVSDCVASGYKLAYTIRNSIMDSGLCSPSRFWCARTAPTRNRVKVYYKN